MDWAIERMPGRLKAPLRSLLGGHAGGALMAFAIRVVSAALAFISQILLARMLGSYHYGVFATVWVWVMVAGTLATLGFATSVIRYLPEYRENGDYERFRGFLHAGHAVSACVGALLAIAGIAFLMLQDGIVGPHFALPMLIALACLPAYALTEFQDGVGRSQGWIDLALGPPYVARPLLLLCALAVAIWAGWPREAMTAAMAALAACWIVAAGQHVMERRRLERGMPRGVRAYDMGPWLRLSLPLLMLEGFSLLLLNLDVLLLNLYVAPDQIGIYAAAVKTISLVGFVQFAVTAVAMPEFARLHARGDSRAMMAFWRKMRRWTFIPSAATAALLLLAGPLLLSLFGPEFPAAWPVMAVLSLGLLARALAGPAQSLLAVSGHQNTAAFILGATVLLNVVLNLVLIPRFGILGTGIAAAVAFAFEAAASAYAARRSLA
jgi:O-antigen/teichoic acid export membrane protein